MEKDCEMQKYLKSLNPSKDQQAILIYGSKYRCWKDGRYLGMGVWTKDENVGDSFQIRRKNSPIQVLVADKWELVIKRK